MENLSRGNVTPTVVREESQAGVSLPLSLSLSLAFSHLLYAALSFSPVHIFEGILRRGVTAIPLAFRFKVEHSTLCV